MRFFGGCAFLLGAIGLGCAVGNQVAEDPPDTSAGPAPEEGGTDGGLAYGYDTGAPPDVPDAPTDAPRGVDSGCPVANTCAGASDIGSVSGDQSPSGNSITTVGTSSKWLKVTVTEDDNGLLGSPLKLNAVLSSPPGANYDLYVYVDEGGSATSRACSTPTAQSTNPLGQIDEANLQWGEGAIPNGSSDTRVVSIEVRNVSGGCGAGHEWSLIVTGNQ